GSTLALLGIILSSKAWSPLASALAQVAGVQLPERFWLNNQQSAFIAACTAAAVYVAVSLVTSRRPYDLDRLLHRGQYAPPDVVTGTHAMSVRDRCKLHNLLRF